MAEEKDKKTKIQKYKQTKRYNCVAQSSKYQCTGFKEQHFQQSHILNDKDKNTKEKRQRQKDRRKYKNTKIQIDKKTQLCCTKLKVLVHQFQRATFPVVPHSQ